MKWMSREETKTEICEKIMDRICASVVNVLQCFYFKSSCWKCQFETDPYSVTVKIYKNWVQSSKLHTSNTTKMSKRIKYLITLFHTVSVAPGKLHWIIIKWLFNKYIFWCWDKLAKCYSYSILSNKSISCSSSFSLFDIVASSPL